MNTLAHTTQENKDQSVLHKISQKQHGNQIFQFVDDRPEAIAQRALKEVVNNSPQAKQWRAFQEMANNGPQAKNNPAAALPSSNFMQRHKDTVQMAGSVVQRYDFDFVKGSATRKVVMDKIDPPNTPLVLAQAAYMSGDRYGIAAALQMDDNLGIMILFTEEETGKADEIIRFYQGVVGDKKRIGSCVTNNSADLYHFLDSPQGQAAAGGQIPELAGKKVVSASYGTKIVERKFDSDPAMAQSKIVTGWLGDEESDGSKEKNRAIGGWLYNTIGMPPGKYALLWVKSGKMTDEKSHHYTNAFAWEQLIDEIGEQTGRTPVLVGEALKTPEGREVHTDPELGAFWDKGYKTLWDGAAARIEQQRLFRFFASSPEYDVISVGMRSGALEGPALVGLRTVYLEERFNEQSRRMEKWARVIPNYIRVILDLPPGREQKAALKRDLEKANRDADEQELPTYKKAVAEYLQTLESEENEFTEDELNSILFLLGRKSDWQREKATDPYLRDSARLSTKNPSLKESFAKKLRNRRIREAVDRAIEEGWISAPKVKTIIEKIGQKSFEELAHAILIEQNKPSAFVSILENLENQSPGGKLTERSIVLLGDAHIAKSKSDKYISSLLESMPKEIEPSDEQLGAIIEIEEGMLEGADINSNEDYLNHPLNLSREREKSLLNLRAFTEVLTPQSLTALEKVIGREFFIELLELASGGNYEPLGIALAKVVESPEVRFNDTVLKELGEAMKKWSGMLTVTGKPNDSLSKLASQISRIESATPDADIRVSGYSGLKSTHPGTKGLFVSDEIRNKDIEYKKIVAVLDFTNMKGVQMPQLIELADIFWRSKQDKAIPKLVTGDWSIIFGLGRLAGKFKNFDNFLKERIHLDSFKTSIEEGSVVVNPIDAPPNPALQEDTPVLKLVNDIGSFRYGTPILVNGDIGFIYGFDEAGNLKVALDDGEIIKTLDPENDEIGRVEGEIDRGFSGTDTRETFEWKSFSVEASALDDGHFQKNTSKRLDDLNNRLVAKRKGLTVSKYTSLISSTGFESFIVGGAVRDILLDKDPKDIDLASTKPAPDMFRSIVGHKGLGKKRSTMEEPEVRKNLPFGTVQVEPNEETGLDIISMHDSGSHGSSLDLRFDALARDFTINALYYDPITKKVHDPTGMGLKDIKTKTVRFIKDPDSLLEHDPVKIARWIKFMSKGEFNAAPGQKEIVDKWLIHHSENMNAMGKSKFLERMGISPKNAIPIAEELGLNVEAMELIVSSSKVIV